MRGMHALGQQQIYSDRAERENFSAVIEAAKAAGIRVVAIDCEASYSINPSDDISGMPDPTLVKERLQTMNFLAAKAVQEYAGMPGSGAWIAYVGKQHANTCQGVPGLAEVTGSLALHVKDGDPSVQTRVREPQSDLTADVEVRMPLQ